MRYKLVSAAAVFCLAVLILALLSSCSINNIYKDNKTLKENILVDINDIIKNAQCYLDGSDKKSLSDSLSKSSFDLVIYNPSGTVIFDSATGNKAGKAADINKIIAEAGSDRRIVIIPSLNEANKFAVALISINNKKLGLDYIEQHTLTMIWVLTISVLLLISAIFIFIYTYLLHPLKRLEAFAGEIGNGNLDVPISQPRHSFFGAFTWAFDMLRSDLKTSKEREAEAERTKKELVAALSHDIRTPIASIKAYAECLQSLPDKNSQRGEKYIDVILEKSDEIARLSEDMFMHAISDLERLEFNLAEFWSRELLNNIIEPLMLHYENRIIITSQIPDVRINTDKSRLAQVFENIVSNSAKYAPGSDIRISTYVSSEMLVCCFEDYGNGVQPEDIPFLFDKFFRGKNAKESGQAGSGLGLYTSRYILEKTGGQIKAYNFNQDGQSGFAVEISLKILF